MQKETDIIKGKIDIVEFLRSYLSLSPAGKNFKALCPFHQEKTPSFIVSPDRRMWHCFGCGTGGDVIKFIMLYENLEFPEALRFLAEKAGVTLQSLNPQQQKEFGILYDLHDEAVSFYRASLMKNERARTYLKKRKLEDRTADEFSLGYAEGGEALTLHLIKKGFDVNDIAKSGLAYKNARGLFRDRFEDRLVFPIYNAVGKAVAFTGRYLGERTDTPKYLNSPETPIFNKSKILYGFHKSKNDIAKTSSAFFVEGQMDFLMAWQSGVKNAIALSGTGLTVHHLEKIRRIAETIIVSFDNDDAGFKALERSFEIFSQFDFHVKAISLGTYKDPAEACERDTSFLENAIRNAQPAFSHLLQKYFGDSKEEKEDVAYTKRVTRHLLEKISVVKSEVGKNILVKELARAAGTREDVLSAELEKVEKEKDEKEGNKEVEGSGESEIRSIPSRTKLIMERLISLAFTHGELWDIVKAERELFTDDYASVFDDPNSEKAELLKMRGSYEFSDMSQKVMKKEMDDLISHLRLEGFKKKQAEVQKKLRVAELEGREDEIQKLLKEFDDIAKKIHTLKIGI